MRKGLVLCAIALWVVAIAAGQTPVGSVNPAKPKLGETVNLTYNPDAQGAALKNPTAIIAEVMVLGDEDPVVFEPTMKKSGSLWKGSFTVPKSGAQLILYRFRSGQVLDDNGENTWRTLVYGNDGSPVRGAYLARATLHQYANLKGFKSQKDTEAASADIDAELKIYPDSYGAHLLRWSFMGRAATSQEGIAAIRPKLDALLAKHQEDEEAVAQLLSWYDRIGDRQKADSIRTVYVAATPMGLVAEAAQRDRIYQERDPATRVHLIEQFLKAFPQEGSALENFQMQLFAFSLRANDYAKAEAVLASMERPSGQMYNSLAWPPIERGENLEQAVAWAKKGLALLDPNNLSLKPADATTAEWKRNTTFGRGMVLDTYAYGLMKLGKSTEAVQAFDEALRLTEYQDPEINQRAVECLTSQRQYQKAIDVSLNAIEKGRANDKLMQHHAEAYRALHGSDVGLLESIESARGAAREALAKKLSQERINKPAVDFALKSLDGSTIRLSSLRGKIVVVDFWATWCGPCIQSFPYLQQVYEKYKNDDDIVILAVNTWESKTGQDLEDLVREFIAKNKYTFPVVFDQGFVDKYGVEGIPTKFIIDQKGMIQFKDIGFGGGEEMMQKMDMQFELLRKGS